MNTLPHPPKKDKLVSEEVVTNAPSDDVVWPGRLQQHPRQDSLLKMSPGF